MGVSVNEFWCRTAAFARRFGGLIAVLFALLALFTLAGCAVSSAPKKSATPEEVDPTAGRALQLRAYAVRASREQGIEEAMRMQGEQGTVVIGQLFRLHQPTGLSSWAVQRGLRKHLASWQLPEIPGEQLRSLIDGTALVITSHIPMVGYAGTGAVVLKGESQKLSFTGLIASQTFGVTGDLVVATPNGLQMAVVRRVLCPVSDPRYVECAARYSTGRFDVQTGRKVDLSENLSSTEPVIDPVTYERVGGPTPVPKHHLQ
jgi:hypothetical protein